MSVWAASSRVRCFLPFALIGLAVDGCPRAMHAPAADAARSLQSALLRGKTFDTTLSSNTPTVLVTIAFPDSGTGRPTVRIWDAGLGNFPPVALGPASPRSVLDRPGLYLAMLDAFDKVEFATSIGDPRVVLYERVDPETGRLSGRVESRKGGAAAVRVPLVDSARWLLFEVDRRRSVSVVYGELPFAGMKPRSRR